MKPVFTLLGVYPWLVPRTPHIMFDVVIASSEICSGRLENWGFARSISEYVDLILFLYWEKSRKHSKHIYNQYFNSRWRGKNLERPVWYTAAWATRDFMFRL